MLDAIDPKVIEKIQKLLNLKEGAESVGSLAEAENAAARAQELLMKYNLSLEDVKREQVDKRAGMDKIDVKVTEMQDKRESDWVSKLYIAIAQNNLCEIWYFKAMGTVRIFGHKMNVQLVSYIADQMISKIRIAEKYAWKDYSAREPDGEKRGTFRRGFFEGATFGINARLREQKEEMARDSNPFALMVVRKEEEVQEYIYDLYPSLNPANWEPAPEPDPNAKPIKAKKVKPRKGPRQLSSNHGWRSGYESGKAMDINKGMDNQKPKGHI